ncbi:PREDICTED: ras-related protein Rab-3-like [Priapulus caudatus]|uniref:Ras-related protein Rab-3-like n=1 Tax=Priapulus caudatus TaxID=37621 RepID=A0ABM1EMG0_PRICU|nr:PREDICTED: ras-related protein Rab-3-like [Priapulus caudatus]
MHEQFETCADRRSFVFYSVGKTSFLFRYADDSFTSAFVSTVGIDFKVKTVFRNDKRVKLQIWVNTHSHMLCPWLARSQSFDPRFLIPFSRVDSVLMYAHTHTRTHTPLTHPLPPRRSTQIKTYSWDNAQVILVGNKCDMEDERVLSHDRGRQLADQLGVEFFETSAKENVNVKQVFERLVDIICDKMSESLDTDPTIVSAAKGARLTENPAAPQNSTCQC